MSQDLQKLIYPLLVCVLFFVLDFINEHYVQEEIMFIIIRIGLVCFIALTLFWLALIIVRHV